MTLIHDLRIKQKYPEPEFCPHFVFVCAVKPGKMADDSNKAADEPGKVTDDPNSDALPSLAPHKVFRPHPRKVIVVFLRKPI